MGNLSKSKFLTFLVRRLIYTLFVLVGVSIVSFLIIRIAPGNPARMMLPAGATDEQIRAMEIELGLDRPLYEQYFIYMGNVLRGDLGESIFYARPCAELIFERIPATAQLALAAAVISLIVSVPLGIMAGIKKGSAVDVFAVGLALVGQSMSSVWLAVLLILIFGVHLGVLPVQGYGTIRHVILPAVTLGMPMTAMVTRMLRSGMYDVLHEDYITATRAKGIAEGKIYFRYALKNALLPVVTSVGIEIAGMMAGSIVCETVFGWPGIGSLSIQAISFRDYPLIQSIMLVLSAIFVLINMIVDILYTFIDPRVELN